METIRQFLAKQFIDNIQWTDSEDGVLAHRLPVQDTKITLTTKALPLLTDLLNWTREFESPFKSDWS